VLQHRQDVGLDVGPLSDATPSMCAVGLAIARVQFVIPRQPVMLGSEWFASGASSIEARPFVIAHFMP
jgi:hypothetical protein